VDDTERRLCIACRKTLTDLAFLPALTYLYLLTDWSRYGFWMGPVYPNASTDHTHDRPSDCKAGCLFDIQSDPGEHRDLAQSQPSKLGQMRALWTARQATEFQVGHETVTQSHACYAAAPCAGIAATYLVLY
jgi:hypothetical protein